MAMNPAVVKAAAQAAVSVVTDEKSRERMFTLLIAPLAAFILLISLIFHILTMPFQSLGSYFSDSQYDIVRELRIENGYDQIIDANDLSYLESFGLSFAGITFTGGFTEFIYFNQMDSRWADLSYGRQGTIGSSGCGPTSLSMVVSSLTNQTIDPVQMCKWAYENGYRCEGNGSYHSLIPDGAKHFGLNVEGATVKEAQKIINSLAAGKLVIVIMSKGHFTRGGHFIVLRGVTPEGKILVGDPASKKRSEQEWDFSIILNEVNKNAGSGGPFWIIGTE